jgi:hypothetical protein
MKKIFRVVVFVLFFMIFLFDVVILFSQKRVPCQEEKLNQQQVDMQLNRYQISNCYANDYIELKNSILYYKGDKVTLQNVINTRPVLILRFSIFNCPACVNFAFDQLREHFGDFVSDNRIVFIYDDVNMRVSESMFGKIPYVSKEKDVLGLSLENENTPFMFILDQDMKTRHVFIPEKGMPELTDEYLSAMKERYFDK